MLVIRNAQMNALREGVLRNMEMKGLAEWPETERPSREELRAAIARARSYGLVSPEHLMRFVSVARALGIGFDSGAGGKWASDILNDADLTPALKLALIEDRARQE